MERTENLGDVIRYATLAGREFGCSREGQMFQIIAKYAFDVELDKCCKITIYLDESAERRRYV